MSALRTPSKRPTMVPPRVRFQRWHITCTRLARRSTSHESPPSRELFSRDGPGARGRTKCLRCLVCDPRAAAGARECVTVGDHRPDVPAAGARAVGGCCWPARPSAQSLRRSERLAATLPDRLLSPRSRCGSAAISPAGAVMVARGEQRCWRMRRPISRSLECHCIASKRFAG